MAVRRQITVADVLSNGWLHRKIDRFLELWRLLRQNIANIRRSLHEAEARGILRNIFGVEPSRRCHLETVAHYFRDVLFIIEQMRRRPGEQKWRQYARDFVVPVAVIL